uniref:Mediator of RNA polymerase II transcription subunit 23 n=1 Tax=Caenorhabditis tropicalis TaxID=1561998 RepID=A0A1I7UZR2_9PELO
MPPANETINSHIQFIRDGIENFDSSNTAMLAVISNVCRIDNKASKVSLVALNQMIETVDPAQPLFELSYQRYAVNSFAALPLEFMDALTLRTKKYLFQQSFNYLRSFSSEKLPSPSVFETIVLFCRAEDYESAAKDLEMMAMRSLHVTNAVDRSVGDNQNMQKDQCHFLFDFLTYRIPFLHVYSKYSNIVNVLLHFSQQPANNPQNHQIYRLVEQFLMRRWNWRGCHEIITNMTVLFGVNHKENSLMRHMTNPKTFSQPVDNYQFPINPGLLKMALYSFFRAVKITGHEIIVENTLFPTIVSGFGWPEKSTTYFPKWAIDAIKTKDPASFLPNYDEIIQSVHEVARLHPSLTPHQFLIKYGEDHDPLTVYSMMAVLFRIAYTAGDTKPDITSEFYEVMEKKSPKDVVIMGTYLIDYIIADAKTQDCNEQTFKNIAKAAALLIFQWQIQRADRFLLSLIVHPTTDEDAHLCIQIANEFILTPEFQERIKWFHSNVPKKDVNPTEYIKAIVKYHDMFPEFEVCQLAVKNENVNPHLPTYYGCLIERLLPVLDQYLFVALEQQGYKLHPQILQTIALFYKYHATPIHLMYSILFTSHGKMSGPDAKSFVLTFASQIEECHLTEAFEKYNHQKTSREQLLMELIDRMSASLDFVLTPPPFVAKDWKSAELNPGAQTLYLSCIELMASPHSPETLVAAMINVMQMKPHLRPFNVINLIALLLTALPSSYAEALHEEFVAVFDNNETRNLKFEEIVFDNYEESLLLNLPNRARSINVISQNYWTHCNLSLLNSFAQEYVPKLLEHAKTEKDLWYTLRLCMPIIRRYWENWDTAKQMRSQREKFGPLFIMKLIFEKLGAMAEAGVEFVHEQHLCDLFYNCKYVFTGDFLRDTAITEFAKLPEPMRDRLKFYVSQSEPSTQQNEEKEKTPEREPEPEPAPQAPEPPAPAPQQVQHQPIQMQPMMPPPPPQPLHHLQMQHHMDFHPQQPMMAPPTPAQHQLPNMSMHQPYPGAVFHHQMQYGMPHHMHLHPQMQMQQQMPQQMHMNPMMHNMTPQQQYAYMQYMQHQQQQQHHHQPPHM